MDRRIFIAPLCVIAVSSAFAEEAPVAKTNTYKLPQYGEEKLPTSLGFQVGVYLPTNRAVRDLFGKSGTNIGIGTVEGRRPKSNTITSDINFINAKRFGNKLFIGTVGAGYEYHFAEDKSTTMPYARFLGGISYFDYSLDRIGGRLSEKRIGLSYGAEVGVVMSSRLRLAARYNGFSKQSGYDFSGFSLVATLGIFKL